REVRAARRLLAPLPGNPGALAGEGARERLHLANLAAALAQLHATIERVAAVELHIVRHGCGLRRVKLYLLRVALAYLVDQCDALAMQPPRVEHEHADRQARRRNGVRQDHVLSLQTVREHRRRMALGDLRQQMRERAHARRRVKSGSWRFADA